MVKTLLVVECSAHLNWYNVFEGAVLHHHRGEEAEHDVEGEEIRVEQAEWDDLTVVSYDDSGVIVTMRRAKKPLEGTTQETERTVKVDFVLLRSVTRGIKGQDSRTKLFTLMHGNVPSVNSLESAYFCLERPLVFGQLKAIQKKLGKEEFPLIPQTLYSSHRDMIIAPDCPLVGKVGHAHAGYGKMRVKDMGEFQDFRSLCALHGDYVSVEPFIDWDWDGRVQKIGPHYRVFRRTSPNWKGNVGNMSVIEDMELTPRYKQWIDECAQLFGGLDICALDFLHSEKDDQEYILELNDTAIGLVHKHEEEDMAYIRDIVLLRMSQTFPPKKKANDKPQQTTPQKKDKKKRGGKTQQEKETETTKKEEQKERKQKEKEKEESEPIDKDCNTKQLEEELELLKIELARLKQQLTGKDQPASKKNAKKQKKNGKK